MADGRRHWATSVEHLGCYGRSLNETVQVTPEVLLHYALAGLVPMIWPEEAWHNPQRTSPYVLREICTSRLRGSGMEFGAGANPLAVPLHCDVKFADFLPEAEIRK